MNSNDELTTILVVDDELYFLEILHIYALKKGYNVIIENSPDVAYERAIYVEPDLILSDYMMSKMNGLEFCKKIRNHPKLKDCLFIIMTNKPISKEVEAEFHNLPDGWISKTVGIKEMFNKIDKWLKIKKS
ncbi:MAG TPA: response regulator [bacterium]|nr:response regulator [bacterium]HOL46651.1 response regulator [bacterium]HPQ17778.1 response regulator [bacterium]